MFARGRGARDYTGLTTQAQTGESGLGFRSGEVEDFD